MILEGVNAKKTKAAVARLLLFFQYLVLWCLSPLATFSLSDVPLWYMSPIV